MGISLSRWLVFQCWRRQSLPSVRHYSLGTLGNSICLLEVNIYRRNRKDNMWTFNIAPTDSSKHTTAGENGLVFHKKKTCCRREVPPYGGQKDIDLLTPCFRMLLSCPPKHSLEWYCLGTPPAPRWILFLLKVLWYSLGYMHQHGRARGYKKVEMLKKEIINRYF